MKFVTILALLVVSLFMSGCGPSIDVLNGKVKNSVQEYLDSSGVLKVYKMKVNAVSLSPVQEDKYNGRVSVEFNGGIHDVNISVDTRGDYIDEWVFLPNIIEAFAFAAPADAIEFKEVVCREGARMVYEDDTKIQCKASDETIQATLNYDKSGYRDITLTLNLKHKYFEPNNAMTGLIIKDDYIEEIKKSLAMLDKDPEIAEHFRSLPLSGDWNKTTLIKGVKFNMPDKGGVERYGNYMLTITK